MQIFHIPVLLNELKTAFKNVNEGVILDATLGYGGHSYELLKEHKNINLIACDQDLFALNYSKEKLKEFKDRTQFFHCNFSEILSKISTSNLRAILADIGVSSYQLDNDERGFSTKSNFLDMRMNQAQEFSAYELVNTYSKQKLSQIFKDFGELKNADFLAQKIILAREKKEIKSAKELSQIIGNKSLNNRRVNTATLVFQAIRIEVNQELFALNNFLKNIEKARLKNCLLAIICFHSLEDKIVKNYFKKWAKNCICDDLALKCECGNNHALGEILTKKPIVASYEEKQQNSRSSCAKMRVFHFKDKLC